MPDDNARRLDRGSQILVLILTSLTLGVLWWTFLAGTESERKQYYLDETARLMRTAAVFGKSLEQRLGTSALVLGLLTDPKVVRTDLTRTPSDFRVLVDALRRSAGPDLDIRGVDRNGRLSYFDGDGSERTIYVGDRDYVQVPLLRPDKQPYLSEPILSRKTGKWEIELSRAVPSEIPEWEILFASVEFDRLDAVARGLGIRQDLASIRIFVHREDGALLYAYPLPDGFPHPAGPNPAHLIIPTASSEGIHPGQTTVAHYRDAGRHYWVFATQDTERLYEAWKAAYYRQLFWISALTLVLVGSAAGLLLLQSRLRTMRIANHDLARLDPLTGLLNRRAFLAECTAERLRASRNGTPLTLLLLDLDHFKRVNDQFGHHTGDQALRDFGAALVRVLRSTDVLSRFGGEEFAVLLPNSHGPGALESAQRIRREVLGIPLPEGHLSTSVGLATWNGEETFDLWYHRTDQALYRAKANGRNRVEVGNGE